jgi:hypothetical protein
MDMLAATKATASTTGFGCTKIRGLVTRRNRLTTTIGINVNVATPLSAAESAASSQVRATS